MPLTYGSYLKLDALLHCQEPVSEGPEHDELLFIVIHQTYELWFKQILHELDHLKDLLGRGDLPRARHTLMRVLTILKTLVSQVDILETMTPLEFESFRHRLETSSGFQSAQFRELEFLLGAKRDSVLRPFPAGTPERARLEARRAAPALWDTFCHLLHQRGFSVPGTALERDVSTALTPNPDVQRALVEVYARDTALAELCEHLVDLDEGLQEWRYRHVKMVERTIGAKPGTGGSAGVEYLKGTLFTPAFADLWAIRSELG